MKKSNGIVILVLIILGLIFIVWQYYVSIKMSTEPTGCGGDWNYNIQCPSGSYCKSAGRYPLEGGMCSSYINFTRKQ